MALVAATVVPTLLAATATLLYAYQQEQKNLHETLTDTTRALALVVDREIARREAIALTLAGSPTLTRGDLRAFHEYASNIAPTRDKVVVLHALDGSQLVNTRLPFGAPLPSTSALTPERQAIGPLATLVSNVYFAPVGRQHSFAVQVPVLRGGRPVYYISVAGYASALQFIFEDHRLPKGWIASIVDGNGVIVARNMSPEKFVGRRTSERLLAQLKQRSQGVFSSTSVDGLPLVASLSKSPNYGWAVVVGLPPNATPGLLEVVAGFAGLAVLLLAVSVVAAIGVARRLLGPVQRLRLASVKLGSGEAIAVEGTGLHETDQVLAAMREADDRIAAASQTAEARRIEAEAAAQELRKSSERLQVATDASGLAVFTWEPLTDKVEWHNEQPYRIFGVPESDPPITASRFVAEFLEPEDLAAFEGRVKASLEHGAPFSFRCRIRRRSDGERRWIEFTGRTKRAADGVQAAIVGTAADITERITAEDALRESEERLRQLANSIPNLAWIANSDGWITWYNDRWYEYTGTTPADMEGWGWQAVHDPATLPQVMERWQHSLATGSPFEMTFPLRGKDGAYRPFFTKVAPLRDASGAVIHWFGTNTDVSPLKKAEEELREADRRKDEFLAILAHELRNPLAPIRTAAEILKRTGSGDPQVQKATDIIGRQVVHMSGLLNDLLDVSRITRGLVTLDKERVNLSTVLASALEQVRPVVESKQHNLHVRVADPDVAVVGSPMRLTQVVANLIDNSAKYSPPGSDITVEVRRSAGSAVVVVTDNGEGIAPDLLPRVFEPFTQAERGSRSPGGLGLGLAVVRGLVELHGGKVSAHSEGRGQGSRFVIELPESADGEPRPESRPEPATQPTADRKPLHVLVVDDNRDAAETLVMLLRGVGHRAQPAYSATEALSLINKASFDAAILDIGLPDMSGYELATAIRRSARPVGPLFALSGYGQGKDRQASEAAGFSQHFVKPVDPQHLIRVLSSLMMY